MTYSSPKKALIFKCRSVLFDLLEVSPRKPFEDVVRQYSRQLVAVGWMPGVEWLDKDSAAEILATGGACIKLLPARANPPEAVAEPAPSAEPAPATPAPATPEQISPTKQFPCRARERAKERWLSDNRPQLKATWA